MANEERNALAELADKMIESRNILIEEGWLGCGKAVFKAQRIIAELAKVVDCKHPDKFMPLEKPYDDITIFCPVYNGLYEQNSLEQDESNFILDLANAAWNCRAIAAEEGVNE